MTGHAFPDPLLAYGTVRNAPDPLRAYLVAWRRRYGTPCPETALAHAFSLTLASLRELTAESLSSGVLTRLPDGLGGYDLEVVT